MKTRPKDLRAQTTDQDGTAACDRRGFVKRMLTATAAINAPGLILKLGVPQIQAAETGLSNGHQRRAEAFRVRQEAALMGMNQPLPAHPDNGDEALYPNRIGNYSKGLPHDDLGEVDLDAYAKMLRALNTEDPDDFERIPMGCGDEARQMKLTNPQAGLAFELEGSDSHAMVIPPAPALSSAWQAGEAVENYWMALTRDVPFREYDTNPLTIAAAADLSRMNDFRGPKVAGRVTTRTLFRGTTPGELAGPYISQFLWLPVPFGANYVEQRMRTVLSNLDYMTQYPDWLDRQRGCAPSEENQYESIRRYIIAGRDLGQWVHIDVLYQAYFNAMLSLLQPPTSDPHATGIGAPFNPGNPYRNSRTQDGFGTFGGPHIATLLTEVATRALHAVWFQKWYVHRRIRPEVYCGRVHNLLDGAKNYPLHSDVLNSTAVQAVFSKYGTYLLPQAFPEGSPLHPSYGSGHATVAGACVTILKACFDESYLIPNPVQPAADGMTLEPYTGSALTVGGELNKLAFNVAVGRNIAGIHWRSDAAESLKLGEAVALSILREQRPTYNENLNGFTITRFDGTQVTV